MAVLIWPRGAWYPGLPVLVSPYNVDRIANCLGDVQSGVHHEHFGSRGARRFRIEPHVRMQSRQARNTRERVEARVET